MDNPEFLGLNEVHAVLITGIFAAVIAVWALFSQRAIAAKRATLDFIQESQRDSDMIAARQIFYGLLKTPEGLGKWAATEHVESPEANAIRTVLNEHELVSIGIQRGILDDETYRRFYRTIVVQRWQDSASYILARRKRTGTQSLFHEFEELARWYGPNMPKRRFFWSKFF